VLRSLRMSWEDLYRRCAASAAAEGRSRPSPWPPPVPEDVLEEIRGIVSDLSTQLDIPWLEGALADSERRWLAARVLAEAAGLEGRTARHDRPADPERLRLLGELIPPSVFDALIGAAVLERDPSFDGQFVVPAVWIWGWAPTVQALTRYLSDGTDAEKWGAVNALYHASGAWRPPFGPVAVDAEEGARVWNRVQEEMLRQFAQTTDVPLQQTIGRWLEPVPSYPPSLRELAERAHQIARRHPDRFVRTAGRSFDDEGTLYSPLPPREEKDG
jgi:hypothetical protein